MRQRLIGAIADSIAPMGRLGLPARDNGLFFTLESLEGRLVRARHESRLDRILQQLAYPRALLLDLW